MEDKDNERDVINIRGTAKNDDEMVLEEAVTAVTLPSSVPRTSSPGSTMNDHSARVYSNSHHTQVRRSTDNREEDLFLESIAQPLEKTSLQSTTTCTPQQESCGRHFDDPPDRRSENATQLRRGLVDVERIRSK